MADVFPTQLVQRDNPNLRLGIKSSLNSFRKLIASLLMIYKSSPTPKNVAYSKEIADGSTVRIQLSNPIADSIQNGFAAIPNVVTRLNDTPLFKSQLEALQVGIELFLHLGKIEFGENGKQERTGENRYEKHISFSDKMIVLDTYLNAFDNQEVCSLLDSWLNGEEVSNQIEIGIKAILSTFIIDCCYKIKKQDGSEVVFNLENVYQRLSEGNNVIYKDGETVGPMRILNAYIGENMLPDVVKSAGVYTVKSKDIDSIKRHTSLITTSLDLITRQLPDKAIANSCTKAVMQTDADKTICDYLTALRTKPFVLLAGISGTGKSRIVRKLAQATVTEALHRKYNKDYDGIDFDSDRWQLHRPANFELIQVKPNWHNSMDVVGYLSNIPTPHYEFTPFVTFIIKAWQNPDVPFFLCLDEMNLAPVEEYFAEFLSAIESRTFEDGEYRTDPIVKPFAEFGMEVCGGMINTLFPDVKADNATTEVVKLTNMLRTKGLMLPKNLMVIGTVNMDETTFSFSRKVLDRAMSIEMNEVDYDCFLAGSTDDGLRALVEKEEPAELARLLIDRHIEASEVVDDLGAEAQRVVGYLSRINRLMDGTPFKLGYRAVNEAMIYLRASQEFGNDDFAAAMDGFTQMKVLSRIEGDETKLKLGDTATDRQRLTAAEVNADDARRYGSLSLLTALREILSQELGAEALPNATPEVDGDNPQETSAANRQPRQLQSIKKLDNMIDQLDRDHFVSFWN